MYISANTESFLKIYIDRIVDGKYKYLETASFSPTFPRILEHINSGNSNLDIYIKRDLTERIVRNAWGKFEPIWWVILPDDPKKLWEKFLEQELR